MDKSNAAIKNAISASKKLNKLCSRIDNELFCAEVFWCRSAYDGYERWNFKLHRHSFFEMHLVLDGSIAYEISGKDEAVVLTSGSFLFIAPGTPHRIDTIEHGSSVFKLAFRVEEPRRFANLIREKINGFYCGKADSYMTGSIRFMLSQSFDEKPGYDEAVRNQLSAFVICIFQTMFGTFEYLPDTISAKTENDDIIRIAKQFIKDNLREPIKGDDIARQVNISLRHLNRITKHSENMSLSEFTRKIRIEEVKKYLSTTNLSLDRIAEKTGLLSGTHLGRIFKNIEGCTPGQYRKDINT